MANPNLTAHPARTEVSALVRDPLGLFRDEMDDLMSRFWSGKQDGWLSGNFAPSCDLTEVENAFELRMDIPGMEPKDIDVQVHDNLVTISGERKEEKEEKGKTFRRVERRSGKFSRSLTLPCAINEDEVAAEYARGVLTLKLPKCDEAKCKKVSVKGS
jgi:Molecular chaperone (small heat shock protein)